MAKRFSRSNSRGDAFDTRVETIRNRSEAVEDPEAVKRYREFANAYAKARAAENGPDHAYSLDLAIDPRTARVVAIEMNPTMSLDLYATDAVRLMDAICRRFSQSKPPVFERNFARFRFS